MGKALYLNLALAAVLTASAAPADARWSEVKDAAVQVAKKTMTVRPDGEWNKNSARPSKRGETWTIDGQALNDLSFFGAVRDGEPLFREQHKKLKPLPKFSSKMLPTDLAEFIETSARNVVDTPLFTTEAVEPATLGGHPGVRMRFSYTSSDELERKGEAVAAIVGGKLYAVSFDAPAIYYFDKDIERVRRMMANVTIP